jgi:predicted homoserine dehydrogenase-like protein
MANIEIESKQLDAFNEQTKAMVEMCAVAAQDVTKHSD